MSQLATPEWAALPVSTMSHCTHADIKDDDAFCDEQMMPVSLNIDLVMFQKR